MPQEGSERLQDGAQAGPSDPQEETDFIPSDSFTGARAGYVFKKDDAGIGYYKDIPLAERLKAAAEAQKAKPIVVKANNSLLKSLQKRGPAMSIPSGVPKKAKTDDNKDAPRYLKEMERYKQMSCASDTKHDRPLVKSGDKDKVDLKTLLVAARRVEVDMAFLFSRTHLLVHLNESHIAAVTTLLCINLPLDEFAEMWDRYFLLKQNEK
ncbi:hypothetical protein VOLCADRAFT_106858 [Volvox carteri f. nagariensis]|uniref:Uncharacterized protein n=1 Tax=Volvox carteri f. nagariensis TaxID=3068 RepID=D8UA79_VOLCA|nr:uncharacterized protein VOLCADRAFT_106858 [Volvox carteri f. nagariensis]EFJ43428.1 hypothetical protein VOLCADRAFT_106858 [Volvox carteri f. nagariensis]|eukprot:XP_002955575.1 hypothetical protein VOLCADRAFT_106858 [Volvox carteri f. nagariensis]